METQPITIHTLGKYELQSPPLGRGGFGTVYRAHDTSLGREVAVKVLHPQLMVDPGFVERFRNEARLVAGLEHPNLVTVYDLGESEGRAYLVMRYLPGGSLRERIAKRPIPFEEALSILKQVSAGLSAAHAKGIIHRDIKPENILFTADGQAVLSDFGLAKAVLGGSSSSSSSTGGVGTPSYRAPELWRGKPPASPATDQYALACMFSEMLTGQRLFSGDTPDEIITKHLVDGPELPSVWPSGVPEGMGDVVAKALGKDPAKRYAGLGEFVDALEGSLRVNVVAAEAPRPGIGSNVSASAKTPSAPSVAPIPWRKYLPLGALAILIGFLLLGSGLALGVWLLNLDGRDVSAAGVPVAKETTISVPTATKTVTQTATATFTSLPISTFTPTIVSTATLGIDSIIISKKDGMKMVYVPAGEFQMGSNDGKTDEKPLHKVYLDDFWIDQTEVTVQMFAIFLNENYERVEVITDDYGNYYLTYNDQRIYSLNIVAGQSHLGENIVKAVGSYDTKPGFEHYPIEYVSWIGANQYCIWADRRLPTEAEWEKAARGTDGRIYPWGNQNPSPSLFNIGQYYTEPVGQYPKGASPYGVLDMAGNVFEWVSDWYGEIYYQDLSSDNNPLGPSSGEYKVLRGVISSGENVIFHVYDRGKAPPDRVHMDHSGFRCASSTP